MSQLDGVAVADADDPPLVAREKHPRAIRWLHWVNVPLLVIMTWSGLRIYTAHDNGPDAWAFGVLGWELLRFFPEGVNEAVSSVTVMNARLAKGIAFHFTFGWLFALNGLAYLVYLALSREWVHLVPDRRSFGEALAVAAHDLHLRRTAPPQGKYNAAQRVAYSAVVVMGVVIVLSGFAIYKPEQLNLLTRLFLGYDNARLVHFSTTILFSLFVVVHVAQVVRAGWATIASMVTGHEVGPAVLAAPTTADVTAVRTPQREGSRDAASDEEVDA